MTEHPGGQFDNFANTPPTFLTLELRSVGGIMVSIAAFQAVDPGSIPGRRMFCQNPHFDIRGLRKKYFVHAETRIRTWVTAATTQGPNH